MATAVTNGPVPKMATMMTASLRVRMRLVLRMGSSTLASLGGGGEEEDRPPRERHHVPGGYRRGMAQRPEDDHYAGEEDEEHVQPKSQGLTEDAPVLGSPRFGVASIIQPDRPSRMSKGPRNGPWSRQEPETRFFCSPYRPIHGTP